MNKLLEWHNRRLGFKLISVVLIFLALVYLAMTFQIVASEKRILLEQIDTQGALLTEAASIFSIEPLLAQDYPVLDTYVENLARKKNDILFMRIERADGRVVSAHPTASPTGSSPCESCRIYTANITVSPEHPTPLGKVIVGISTRRSDDFVDSRIRILLLQFVMSFLVLVLLLSFLIKKMVGDPIRQLDQQANALAQGNLDTPITLASADEMGRLAGTLEEMRRNLKASYAKIEADNRELIEAKQELEKEITERKQAEEQLVQSAKLAGLGQLGAGIAHELNQPITTIQGFTQRIKRDGGRQIKDHAYELDLIIKASHRMARIVDNIRLFSRQTDFKAHPIDPLTPLNDALMLINEQLRLHCIDVERPAGDGLLRVMGDQVKLQQVFSNLIMNARDSLGTLPKARPRRLVLGVRAEGDRVVYSVEDNGPGISEEDQAQIFDPFFTTKEVGKGTGLGLSISHGIVGEHGGEIRYEPVEGGGARFLVSLPIAPVETTEAVKGS